MSLGNTQIDREQGGRIMRVKSGGSLAVDAGGSIDVAGVVNFTTPEWDDLRTPVTAVKVGAGIREPTWEKFHDNGGGSQGVYALDFSNTQEQEVLFSIQLPHDYVEGSNLHPHVHFATKTGGSGNIKWVLEYCKASINGVFAPTALIEATHALSSETARTHRMTEFAEISGAGLTISAMLHFRLARDVGVAGNYAAAVSFFEFDLHYQIDRWGGSRTEYVK